MMRTAYVRRDDAGVRDTGGFGKVVSLPHFLFDRNQFTQHTEFQWSE